MRCLEGKRQENGSFVQGRVGRMQRDHSSAVKGLKDHGMTAVFSEDGLLFLDPFSADGVVIGISDAGGIALFTEAGPEETEPAVFAAEEEGTVGDIIALFAGITGDPGGIFARPEKEGLPDLSEKVREDVFRGR